jgi:hypothetical protein
MSNIFMTENSQGWSPHLRPSPQPAGNVAEAIAKVVAILFFGRRWLLFFHCCNCALAVLHGGMPFVCCSSRATPIRIPCVLAVVLAMLGDGQLAGASRDRRPALRAQARLREAVGLADEQGASGQRLPHAERSGG